LTKKKKVEGGLTEKASTGAARTRKRYTDLISP